MRDLSDIRADSVQQAQWSRSMSPSQASQVRSDGFCSGAVAMALSSGKLAADGDTGTCAVPPDTGAAPADTGAEPSSAALSAPAKFDSKVSDRIDVLKAHRKKLVSGPPICVRSAVIHCKKMLMN